MTAQDFAACAVDDVLTGSRPQLESLVGEMVAINSQIPPFGTETEIVRFLSATASGLGLPGGKILSRQADRPNLIIRIPGSAPAPGTALMMNGHVDTKPVGDARDLWHTEPLQATRLGENIFGLGVSDMKAAVAAMLFAAHAIKTAGVQLRGDLVLCLVADEEAGASFGARYVAPLLGGEVDACLIGEPSGWQHDWQGIHLVSRGLCEFKVRVRGTQMHSSLSDRMPSVNANVEMARLILRMPGDFAVEYPPRPDDVNPTLNVAVTTEGGVFYGVVPGEAAFGCDLRTVPGMTEQGVRAFLDGWARRMSAEPDPVRTSIEYDEVLQWIPSAALPGSHRLAAAAVNATAAVLGAAPPLSVFPGTTDAPWLEAAGIPTLPSLGPGILTHCHGPNEFVRAESIHQAARIYARLIMDFCEVHGS